MSQSLKPSPVCRDTLYMVLQRSGNTDAALDGWTVYEGLSEELLLAGMPVVLTETLSPQVEMSAPEFVLHHAEQHLWILLDAPTIHELHGPTQLAAVRALTPTCSATEPPGWMYTFSLGNVLHQPTSERVLAHWRRVLRQSFMRQAQPIDVAERCVAGAILDAHPDASGPWSFYIDTYLVTSDVRYQYISSETSCVAHALHALLDGFSVWGQTYGGQLDAADIYHFEIPTSAHARMALIAAFRRYQQTLV